MVFNKNDNSKKQGEIGEACAIYEYTKAGYVVCKPVGDSAKFDLIVEKDGLLKRVQVKTSASKARNKYAVNLKTCGGNRSGQIIRKRHDDDYDELFVLTSDGQMWMIPSSVLPNSTVSVESSKFDEYKVG